MPRLLLALLLATLTLPAQEPNLIDRHIFAKIQADKIPVATPASDSEFLRRLYLDLTGQLPPTSVARQFLADPNPQKRTKLIDSLFPPLPVSGMRSVDQAPILDRWTYFFNDLFRNSQLLQ